MASDAYINVTDAKRWQREAVLAERAAIVAWLRDQRSWTTRVLDKVADAIEQGAYLEEVET